jgi:hypothetical protein
VAVYGRITSVSMKNEPPAGYWLSIAHDGAWRLLAGAEVLATGRAGFASNKWQRIGLRFAGPRIAVLVNGRAVHALTDTRYTHGLAGLGCSWQRAWFDNFRVLAGVSS